MRDTLREVSFAEACAWLVSNGQRRPPEMWLALHGIQPEGAL